MKEDTVAICSGYLKNNILHHDPVNDKSRFLQLTYELIILLSLRAYDSAR